MDSPHVVSERLYISTVRSGNDKEVYLGDNGSPKLCDTVTFLCSIGGCEDFGHVWVKGKSGSLLKTEMQECKRCTVVFHSAVRFSNG